MEPFYSVAARRILPATVICLSITLTACSSSNSSEPATGTDPDPDLSVSTPAPGADDEPILEDALFNTASGFVVTREPGPRLAVVEEAADLTDADFDLGLPAAVVQVPDGLDTSVNQAPFFANLENQDVLAGEILEIVYRPEDPDGGLPGMFPEKLPQGGSFVDNFDGSKTFRWQPLQADVGINRFTVTAVDAENGQYRVSQPLLIRVSLPADLASIPNVAPELDTIKPHYVRVNDPVVMELKGIDLNGSIPSIEAVDLPVGATLTQDPRFEEIYVLKFVPVETGLASVDVIVRDSVDSSLTTEETVSVSVLSADDFEHTGQPLRELATNRNIQIGFAALQSFYHRPDGAIYAHVAAREYDIVTPENSLKMDYINPDPGRYQFAATDNAIAFARQNDMTVHGHPLIWYRQVPDWVLNAEADSRELHMTDFITRIMSRYQNDISIWDVVNEPMDDNGGLRDSVWLEAMGESYIATALQTARDVSPQATLLINEFDISMAGPKFDGLMSLVDRLQAQSVPLDGIGFQMHLFTSYDQFDALRQNFAAVADKGLDIYITELDVSLDGDDSQEDQASAYRQIMEICLEQPNCKAVQTWGLTDQYSFRTIYDPLLFDRSYQAKPAYFAVQEALQQ